MKNVQRVTLRLRLLLLLLISIFPGLVLTLYEFVEEKEQAKVEAQDFAFRLASILSIQQQDLIGEAKQVLFTISQIPKRGSANSLSHSRFMAHLLANLPQYSQIGVADTNGNIIASAVPTVKQDNIANRSYFRAAIGTGDLAVGEYQVSQTTGKPAINFAYPIVAENGRTLGVLYAKLSLDTLGDLESRVGAQLLEGWGLREVDKNGVILAQYPSNPGSIGHPVFESSQVLSEVTHGQGTLWGTDSSGKSHLYAHSEIRTKFFPTGLSVILDIPGEYAMSAANHIFIRNMVLLSVVGFLILLFGAAANEVYLVRGLIAVRNAAVQLTEGNLGVRVERVRGLAEVKQLGMTFNHMAGMLEKREKERQQADEEIRRHAAHMDALAEITRACEEVGLDYQRVLDRAARRLAELIGDSCLITQMSDDGHRLFPVAFHHTDTTARAIMHDTLMHTWQGGIDIQRCQTLLSGNSIYIASVKPEDLRTPLEPEFQDFLDAVGVSSLIIVPIQIQGRFFGALGMARDRHHPPYSPDDLVLLQDLANRAALKIQNARLFSQIEGAREQQEALSRRLMEAQETERRHLALELHDQIGQALTAIKLTIQSAQHSTDIAHVRAKHAEITEAIDRMINAIRDLSLDLHLSILDDLGLVPAIRWYLDRHTQGQALQANLTAPSYEERLSPELEIACFRIFQEACANIFRHARAQHVSVKLELNNGDVVMSITDDGRGFSVDQAEQDALRGKSLGLLSMRERAANVGGTLEIVSTPGKGTTLTVRIPLHKGEPTE